MAIDIKKFGINEFVWLKTGLSAATGLNKLVLGVTKFDVSESATAIDVATQNSGGVVGAEYGFIKNSFTLTLIDHSFVSGDVTSLYTVADFRSALTSRTKIELAWGKGGGASASVVATGDVLTSAKFVVTDIKKGSSIDDKATVDISLQVDGAITSITATA